MSRLKHLSCSVLAAVAMLLVSCESEKPVEKVVEDNTSSVPKTPLIAYTVLARLPHDSTCFTEGFFFNEGRLFESSGAPDHIPAARSLFGIVDQKTGKIDVKGELDRKQYFGEGIVILNNTLYQLTYTNQVVFMYDAKTFRNQGTFGLLSRQGWGLTTNGKELIMSDGSDAITFIDPKTYQISKTLLVSENNYAIDDLNELEYINGFIYANVWMQNIILKIDPENGNVVGKMDLTELATEARKRYAGAMEMNGIAHDPATGRFLITGKMWPTIYELKVQL